MIKKVVLALTVLLPIFLLKKVKAITSYGFPQLENKLLAKNIGKHSVENQGTKLQQLQHVKASMSALFVKMQAYHKNLLEFERETNLIHEYVNSVQYQVDLAKKRGGYDERAFNLETEIDEDFQVDNNSFTDPVERFYQLVNQWYSLTGDYEQITQEKLHLENMLQNIDQTYYPASFSDMTQQVNTLNSELNRLDDQREAVLTEIEAVRKVIAKNISSSFKTFG